MIEQEEISSLIPLEPEELESAMGATPSSPKDDEEKEIKTLEDKKEHLKTLYKPIINSIEGNSAYSDYEKQHRIEDFKKEHEKQVKDIEDQITELRKKKVKETEQSLNIFNGSKH